MRHAIQRKCNLLESAVLLIARIFKNFVKHVCMRTQELKCFVLRNIGNLSPRHQQPVPPVKQNVFKSCVRVVTQFLKIRTCNQQYWTIVLSSLAWPDRFSPALCHRLSLCQSVPRAPSQC